jgi:hypothetical protein
MTIDERLENILALARVAELQHERLAGKAPATRL